MITELINPISEEVDKIFSTKFTYAPTNSVPNVESNADLTYSDGVEQKGLELTTCVLFVDIRDSVKINNEHYTHTKGRIYTSFVASVLRIAKYHHGYVRNIIGDRVMVVFEPENCFKNSVECAVSINHVASQIITTKVPEFHVGIGVDYGMMKVYKVGIVIKGDENAENKNLVWIGEPANFASRLTDMAGKRMEEKYNMVQQIFTIAGSSLPRYFTLSKDNLIQTLVSFNSLDFNSIQSIETRDEGTYQDIMITDDVYKGLKKEKPNCNSLRNGWWVEANGDFRGVTKKVWQASLIWEV